MEISEKIVRYFMAVVIAAFVVLVLVMGFKHWSSSREILRLQNVIAARDKTIESQKNVYEKLALQEKDLLNLLDSKDQQARSLKAELKKNHEDLLVSISLSERWKSKYESAASAQESAVGNRLRVEFEKDFGYLSVSGHTLTNPAEAWVSVSQGRPLRLNVLVSRDREGAWRTRISSSEDNVSFDISTAAVDPGLVSVEWYERLGVTWSLGAGSGPSGAAFLAGGGVSLALGKFELGPSVWFAVSDRVDRYYGASFTWHPFQR